MFNMGHRFEIYLSPDHAGTVIDMAAEFGLEAKIIGRCNSASERKLTIETSKGRFEYK